MFPTHLLRYAFICVYLRERLNEPIVTVESIRKKILKQKHQAPKSEEWELSVGVGKICLTCSTLDYSMVRIKKVVRKNK